MNRPPTKHGHKHGHHHHKDAPKLPALGREGSEPSMSFEKFVKERQEDPHKSAKARIKSQIESVYAQKRLVRLDDLSLFVKRAFDLAVATGEVVIGRDRDELGDDGMKHVTSNLEEWCFISGLTLSSHCIGPSGSTQLAHALRTAPQLVSINLNNNLIEFEGANKLAECLKTLPTLQILDFSENRIGPTFPDQIIQCTSLTTLVLHHNNLENIPSSLGMHPNLRILDVAYNRIKNLDDELIRQGTVPMLRELVDQDMAACCYRGNHNRSIHTRTAAEDIVVEMENKMRMCIYPLYELEVTVDKRWHEDDEWLSVLLEKHTSLRALNGLHEWPTPPLAETTEWNLDGALQHPLYESVFVRNCIRKVPLTSLIVSNNDLRGRAAIMLADAVSACPTLRDIDVSNCQWDEGMIDFALAVRGCKGLVKLNNLVLEADACEWDLRGCLKNVFDVAFVASRLESQGKRLCWLDLSSNSFTPEESQVLTRAIAHAPNLTYLNGLSLGDSQLKWDLRRRLVDGRTFEDQRTYGTMPLEFEFIGLRLKHTFVLSELDLSGNSLKDQGVHLAVSALKHVTQSLLSLNLNQNELTKSGATTLSQALLGLTRLQMVRISDNIIETEGAQAIVDGLTRHFQMEQLFLDDSSIGPLIPKGIDRIKTLQVLSLRYNKLRILGTDICELPKLRALLVDHNPIEIPSLVVVRRGFSAIMSFLQDAHKLTPLRAAHLSELTKDKAKDIDPHILEVQNPKPGTQLSRATMAERHQHVQDIARASVRALEVAPEANSSAKSCTTERVEASKFTIVSNLQRHGKVVTGCCFHSINQVLATCSADRSIKIWQPSEIDEGLWTCAHTLTAQCLCYDGMNCGNSMRSSQTLKDAFVPGHLESVVGITFSPPGLPLMLASGSHDGTARVWVPETVSDGTRKIWVCGQVLGNNHERHRYRERSRFKRKGHQDLITCVAFRPRGDFNLLATGSDDETIRIWGERGKDAVDSDSDEDAAEEQDTETAAAALYRHQKLDELHYIYKCFCKGEVPAEKEGIHTKGRRNTDFVTDEQSQIYKDNLDDQGESEQERGKKKALPHSEAGKRLGMLGERRFTMDMAELLSFYEYSGMMHCVPKTLITRLFKEVNVRHLSGSISNDVHELDWEEFLEILFLISTKTTHDVEGQRKVIGRCVWTEYGMLEQICGVHVAWLGKHLIVEEAERTLNWTSLFTLEGHKGSVTALAWLPSAPDMLASASQDEHIMIWHNTVSRGRSLWTNVFKATGHTGIVNTLSFGLNEAGNIVLATCSSDRTVSDHMAFVSPLRPIICLQALFQAVQILFWRVTVRDVVRETLDGPVEGHAYVFGKGERLQLPDDVVVKNCSFRGDGRILAAGCSDNSVRIYAHKDRAWEQIDIFLKHSQAVRSVSFGGGGKRPTLLATCGDDGRAFLVDSVLVMGWVERDDVDVSTKRIKNTPSSQFPPRLESKTFRKRPTSTWKFAVPKAVMDEIFGQLSGSSALKKEAFIQSNHGGTMCLQCQPYSRQHDIRIEFPPRTVWNRTRLGMSAINIDVVQSKAFEDIYLVSPIVDFTPVNSMFRQPVKLYVPHNSAHPDMLTMVYFSFGEWHAVEKYEITETHAIATLESFDGPMAVVFSGDFEPMDIVYSYPLTMDGRPLEDVSLCIGESLQCQLEILPCSSVQQTTAQSDAFKLFSRNMPVYRLRRGTAIDNMHIQSLAANKGFSLRTKLNTETAWDGVYALLMFTISAEKAENQRLGIRSPSARTEDQSSMSPPEHRPRTTQGLVTMLPPPSAHRAIRNVQSSGAAVDARRAAELEAPESVFAGIALDFANACDVMLLKPIKVTVQELFVRTRIMYDLQARVSKVWIKPLPINKVTTLADLREHVMRDLEKPTSRTSTGRTSTLRQKVPAMEFRSAVGDRVPADEEKHLFAYQFRPQISLQESPELLELPSVGADLGRSRSTGGLLPKSPTRPGTVTGVRVRSWTTAL